MVVLFDIRYGLHKSLQFKTNFPPESINILFFLKLFDTDSLIFNNYKGGLNLLEL